MSIEPYHAERIEALEGLHKAGAHLIRCRADKCPCGPWKDRPAKLSEIIDHGGAPVGLIPSSIGSTVVDVDHGATDRVPGYNGARDVKTPPRIPAAPSSLLNNNAEMTRDAT